MVYGEPGGQRAQRAQRAMKASEFKAKCLNLVDEVAIGGGEIVIAKNGKPVAKFTALSEGPKSLFGAGRGRMKIVGDIISPVDVEWEAQSDPGRAINQ